MVESRSKLGTKEDRAPMTLATQQGESALQERLMTAPILLASASPRRREILRTLGIPFVALAVDADETLLEGESPESYLERVVTAKLSLATPLARERGARAVIVADTTVVLGEEILAKPLDPEDNARMVRALGSIPVFRPDGAGGLVEDWVG